jgi:WD40 repeat protein
VTSLALSRDGLSALAAIDYRPKIYVWDLSKAKRPLILDAPGEALDVAFSDRDQSILAFTRDGTLCQWNFQDHSLLKSVGLESRLAPDPLLKGHKRIFKAATFFAGGDKLAVVGFDTQLHLIDAQKGTEIGRARGATRFAASPDASIFAIAKDGPEDRPTKITRMNGIQSGDFCSTSGTIVLLDSQTLEEKLRLDVEGSEVWAMAFSADGKTLAATSGREAGQIHFYDVANGRMIRTIHTPARPSPALAFSPDTSRIACGMADTSVLIWDIEATP